MEIFSPGPAVWDYILLLFTRHCLFKEIPAQNTVLRHNFQEIFSEEDDNIYGNINKHVKEL